MEKEELEKHFDKVWTTEQATKEFTFISFLSPFVSVVRKSDGVKGTLEFQDSPRYYFGFIES